MCILSSELIIIKNCKRVGKLTFVCGLVRMGSLLVYTWKGLVRQIYRVNKKKFYLLMSKANKKLLSTYVKTILYANTGAKQ